MSLCPPASPWSPWDTSSTLVAPPLHTHLRPVWVFLLNPTLLYRTSPLWSQGAPSSPLVQTEHLLPSPPRPAPPPLSSAKMGSLVVRATPASHPGQSCRPLSLMMLVRPQVPSPSLLRGFCPLAGVSRPAPTVCPTLTPVPAFCESHLRPVLPTPRCPVLSLSCIKWSF